MTRNPKVDPQVLEREYVFSPDKISLTDLADSHQLARSGVADKARGGRWYEKRLAYWSEVERNVLVALGQKWAEQGVALREKVLRVAEATLDRYLEALADTEKPIRPDAKDAALMTQVIRTTLGDIEAAARPNEMVIEGEAVRDMNPEEAQAAITMARRLLGEGGGDAPDRDAGDA